MKELQKYYTGSHMDAMYIASEADTAFAAEIAEIKQQHAEEIERLLAALRRANDGCAASIERESALRKQAERYEKLRSLNVRDFQALYMRNIRGEGRFDDLLDQLPASGEASVEEQHGRME